MKRRFKQDLREAIIQAEDPANYTEYTQFSRGYAMGLRVAAGLAGMKKWNLDPRTRAEKYR